MQYETYRRQDDAMCMNIRAIWCRDNQIAQEVVQVISVQCTEHILYMFCRMIHLKLYTVIY